MRYTTIFPLIVLFLFCLSVVSATTESVFPMPVFGKTVFNGVVYANQEITLKSTLWGKTWVTRTNNNGVYQFELANLKSDMGTAVYPGHVFEIYACPVDVNVACKKTFTAEYKPIELLWGIDTSTANDLISPGAYNVKTPPVTVIEPKPQVVVCKCDTGEPTVCPVVPAVVCPTTEPEECEQDWNWISDALIALGALCIGGSLGVYMTKDMLLGANSGIKRYTGKDGKDVLLHRHPGIVGYHDPNTLHKVVKERHPKGLLNPKYVKDSTNEWMYVEG